MHSSIGPISCITLRNGLIAQYGVAPIKMRHSGIETAARQPTVGRIEFSYTYAREQTGRRCFEPMR